MHGWNDVAARVEHLCAVHTCVSWAASPITACTTTAGQTRFTSGFVCAFVQSVCVAECGKTLGCEVSPRNWRLAPIPFHTTIDFSARVIGERMYQEILCKEWQREKVSGKKLCGCSCTFNCLKICKYAINTLLIKNTGNCWGLFLEECIPISTPRVPSLCQMQHTH